MYLISILHFPEICSEIKTLCRFIDILEYHISVPLAHADSHTPCVQICGESRVYRALTTHPIETVHTQLVREYFWIGI